MNNLDNIELKVNEVESQSERLTSISNKILKKYLGDLDEFLSLVQHDMDMAAQTDVEIPTQVIDRYILQLSPRLYWAVEGVEKLGLQEDIAEEIRKSLYNKALLDSIEKLKDNKAADAEENTRQEKLIKDMYTHCYRTAKGKVEYGFEQLKSLKKILSKRMLDMQIAMSTSGVRDSYMEDIGSGDDFS